jgi:hypothetical protein
MCQLTIANSTARKLLLVVLVLGISLMVVGEGNGRNAFASNPQQAASGRSQNVKINIKVGGKVLTATLADNATAQDFASVLPLSVSMNDLFGREKYGDLPKALSQEGPRQKRYVVGDIAYWSPDHQFAIYYHQDGESIPAPGIIPIARIESGTEAFNVSGSVRVTIELVK